MYPVHQPLITARALYIGRAAPSASLDGLEAAQKPLAELYSKSDQQCSLDDRDCTVTVLTSGILMKPINTLDSEVWLRIQDLESCMSVRGYNDPGQCGGLVFVPSDSPPGRSSPHPVLFAALMKRRTGGLALSDCYAFVCPGEEVATTLVRAASAAFQNPCGWREDRPTAVQAGVEAPVPKIVERECYVDDYRDDCAPEFYEKPALSGFFYTPRTDLIQKYAINQQGDFCRLEIQQAPAPAPPPPPPPTQYIAVEQSYQPQQLPLIIYPEDYEDQQPQYLVPAQLPGGVVVSEAPQQQQQIVVGVSKEASKAKKIARKLQQNYGGGGGGGVGVVVEQPVYMASLPQDDVFVARANQTGYGDVGAQESVLLVDDGLYARRLPGSAAVPAGGRGVWVTDADLVTPGGMPFDGNFILRQHDAYRGLGPAQSFGAIAVNDQY